MKAIIKYAEEAGSFEVREVDIPKPKKGEVLVQIKVTAIRKPIPIPITLGHEGTGVIADLGEDVNSLTIGDRVGFEPLRGCGKCINCKLGDENMCHNWEHLGITRDGTFAEYVVVSEDSVHKLPKNVSFGR